MLSKVLLHTSITSQFYLVLVTRPGRNHVCDSKPWASLVVGSSAVGAMLVSVLKFSLESFFLHSHHWARNSMLKVRCHVKSLLFFLCTKEIWIGILSLFLSYQQLSSLSPFCLSVGLKKKKNRIFTSPN